MAGIEQRKEQHIKISLSDYAVYDKPGTWLDKVVLIHQPLTELLLDEVDTRVEVFGKRLSAPIIVSAITGGARIAEKINATIARAVEKLGLGMCVGSQRAALEGGDRKSFEVVKEEAPTALKVANIGAAQICRWSDAAEKVAEAIDMIDADAVEIHVNALQELLQPEGDAGFSNLIEKIREIKRAVKKPVIVKEVGTGFSMEASLLLREIADAIDVAGAGGTSFTRIERVRAILAGDLWKAEVSRSFDDWGIPTAASIAEVRSVFRGVVIASGGLKNGVDAAKAIAFGADIAAYAREVLKHAYFEGVEGVERFLSRVIQELKIAMVLTCSKTIKDLRKAPIVVLPPLSDWVEQRIGLQTYVKALRARGGVCERVS